MSGFALVVRNGKTSEIPLKDAPAAEGDLVWVHLSTNDEMAQTWLSQRAKLSEYIVDSLTATETRPRCDMAPGDGAFINLRGSSSEELDPSDLLASIRLYATRGRVYSVTRKVLDAIAVVKEEVKAVEVDDPGDLITAFAVAITEELDPVVADLGDSLDDCEAELGAENAIDLRRTVNRARIRAIGFRRFLNPQRAALEKLATLSVDWLEDDDRLHLSAAADRAARMAEELDAIRERAALIHETLTDLRAEQLDQRSLMIGIVALVFLPLTFITGLLGMNVRGIPYAQEPWAFDGVLAICAILAAAITIYFVQRHWFRR